jgi:SAM-dependent methyltransferase
MARVNYCYANDMEFAAILRKSVTVVTGKILDIYPAKSVVDIGCNVGFWLKEFADRGVERIFGVDGAYVEQWGLLIDRSQFLARDLNKRIGEVGRYDLALCLEVAEHLDVSRADSLVAEICGFADVVVFSAAIPFQSGEDHINEQWQSYWVKKFATNEFDPYDVLRREIWAAPDVFTWYKQNTLFYVRRGSAAAEQFRRRYSGPSTAMFDVVHPEHYRHKIMQLKHGNVVNKTLNRFRTFSGVSRATVLTTPLVGDDHYRSDQSGRTHGTEDTR